MRHAVVPMGVIVPLFVLLMATSALQAAETSVVAQAGAAQERGEERPLDFEMRMREIEDRVGELKDDLFRSKARLFLLREQILQDRVGGARVVINHLDDTGSRFRIVRVLYSLDGEAVFAASTDTANLDAMRHEQIHAGSVVAGPHNIAVQVVMEGGRSGIFSYMSDYRFTIRSSFAFNVDEGQTAEVTVRIHQAGGVNAPIEQRPEVSFSVERFDTLDALSEQTSENGGAR